ncbi:hypothetical protein [Rhodanobacter geophilus]|uniref:Tetratricopeptide repeat protein n=1 Tax=Rhodanobacter geophilus TaxID=3162488 RepID=A0ABV3QPA9_9GAMM
MNERTRPWLPWLMLALAVAATAAVYWSGLSGDWLFDDYPNIVDNLGVQPTHADLASLVNAALSSPASEFKRPLASLSFALNYLAGGLNPFGWKLTNLVIHLLNGLLVFVLARLLVAAANAPTQRGPSRNSSAVAVEASVAGVTAALIAACWMLLPINLTGVLYVVQREESMANLFVLAGLIGYVVARCRMTAPVAPPSTSKGRRWREFWLCALSITVPAAVGVLAKETAVMLPLYALLVEWALFRFSTSNSTAPDRRIIALFVLVLALPMVVGLAWLLPGVLNPAAWATRDFTLGTRLLSETRVVVGYLVDTLLPTPQALSFYHDNFRISNGLLAPWTTLASIITLIALVAAAAWLRPRQPLAALGIALFLGCQSLTGTILPLELIYEHRNYFASFGLMLALVPLLVVRAGQPMLLSRRLLLGGLLLLWASETAMTATAWGNPLLLAETLAARAPDSPRAQYELGRTCIIYSHYDPASPFTKLAYAPLERAAALPDASILPEQALIFMNSRMHLPIKDAWWNSLIGKLKAHKPGVQDESSLAALTKCVQDNLCNLPINRMVDAFLAALSHPNPDGRLLANYGDYGWNVLGDRDLGLRMTEEAVKAAPAEPAYRITLVRMFAALGRKDDALDAIKHLEPLNYGGRLNSTLAQLRTLPGLQ